jgi:ribosomal protein L37AE/L43A
MECLIKDWFSRQTEYVQRQFAFKSVKNHLGICPKCGNNEIYYENPRTGNGLYNCDYCGHAAHGRKFKQFKVRKCIARRWRNEL